MQLGAWHLNCIVLLQVRRPSRGLRWAIRALGITVLSLLVSSDCVKSQQPLVGLIQGKIIDQKRAPVPYAGLTATNIDSVEPESSRRTTGADEKGFYQLVDVPEGRYSIVVKKTGYRDYKISVVTVRAGETVNMPDIKLSPSR